MKIFLITLLSLITFPALAETSLVKQLAIQPIAITDLQNKTCAIRGAVVIGDKPFANVHVELKILPTGRAYQATTSQNGIYSLSIPYNGKPIALHERIISKIYVKQGLASKAQTYSPSVVCSEEVTAAFLANRR